MDNILFGLKRAHWGGVRAGRGLTDPFGLTPARFDMLFVLLREKLEGWGYTTQRRLRLALGVSAPTVSRMLRSLEDLSLVWRKPRHNNTREVGLTARGYLIMRRAAKRILHSGLARRVVDRALRRFRRALDLERRATLDELLGTMRRSLGDASTLYYPWDPDD